MLWKRVDAFNDSNYITLRAYNSRSEAAVNTRDAKKNSNEDSTSLSSSNSKSVPSRRSNKITDLIKRKVKRDRAD